MVSIQSIVSGFDSFGFSGSRSCPSATAAAELVFPFLPEGSEVSVGCAGGVDAAARLAFQSAQVFRVSDYGGAALGAAAFARRSAALVQAVASSRGLLIVFPSTACPAAVQPSRRFAGSGSGSWGSAALAVGLGCAVLICLPAGATAPAWLQSAGVQVQEHFWFVQPTPSLF